jgi:hypothetical protein
MYQIRNSEGKFVATARTKAAAHRATRTARHAGTSVNRASSTVTTVIRHGWHVLAKEYHGVLMPVTYANRAQAWAKVQALGVPWTVLHFGRPFFVGRSDEPLNRAGHPPEAPRYLTGHVSPETAYLVEDYPYGFRLRTKIRYWIETTKHGQRFVSQTMNPKVPGERWNKPKASTYVPLMVMTIDTNGHVHYDAIGGYDSEEKLDAFIAKYPEAFTSERDQSVIKYMRAGFRASKRVTYTVTSGAEAAQGPRQTIEEQTAIMRALTREELRKMGSENRAGGIVERRAQAILDKPIRVNGVTMTRREFIDRARAQGAHLEVANVRQPKAEEKLREEIERAERGWHIPIGNPSHPDTVAHNEKKDRLKRGLFTEEYRLFRPDGVYNVITKTEADYFNS